MAAFDNRTGFSVATTATVLSATQNPLKLANARTWHLVIENTGVNSISAVRIRRRPSYRSAWAPWEAITSGLPFAAGATLSIRETDDASSDLDVELTASVGATTVSLRMGSAL